MNFQSGLFFQTRGGYGQTRNYDPSDPLSHAYVADGTFSANPAFQDYEFDLFDPSASNGIGVNEAVGEDIDSDPDYFLQLAMEIKGELERDMIFPFPMQMLQKDGDFEQVGEVLNVWLLRAHD